MRSEEIVTSSDEWRPVVNGLLHSVQFRERLDADYAAEVAQHLIARPIVGISAERQYAALAYAVESGTDLTRLTPDAHDEADFRAFISMIVERMDALRPWPAKPFEKVPMLRWSEFSGPVLIGRLAVMSMVVERKLRMGFVRLADTGQRCLVLRLSSGALVALVAGWWPGSRDIAVLAQNDEDPETVIRALFDAAELPEGEFSRA